MSRRVLLGGGGAVLALPWLEALSARPARGQAAEAPRRFLPIFFPCGVPSYWWPAQAGAGAGWQLGSVLEPFAPIKERLLLLGNVENYTPFNADGSTSVETSHGRLAGAFLTCVDAKRKRQELDVPDTNGVSADQVLAEAWAGRTPVQSLQLGLSSIDSYCDGEPCSNSRVISWSSQGKPLPKLIDPQKVFDRLFASGQPTPAGQSRDRSVIDAVLANSRALQPKLGAQDRQTLERYLTALRELELNVARTCPTPPRPSFSARVGLRNGDEGYDRGQHFDVMNQLIALAFQCDITRVISFMLDDERSEFQYDHLKTRHFTATTSTEGEGQLPFEYHGGGQSGGDNNSIWCTIMWWFSSKLSELCQQLAAMPEGEGSVLDNTVVFYGSSMQGETHSADNLPTALVAAPHLLRTDQYLRFEQPCARRDVFYTLLSRVFGLELPSFGESAYGIPNRTVTEVLA